jgi:predicted neuraminidase
VKKLLCVILIFAPCPGFVLGGDIVIETVFGPDPKIPGPYKHPASITELDNGDLYLVYYGGTDEYGDDTAVYGARKAKGSDRWTMPVVVADTPDRSEGNGVVWQAPDHKVWLFYLTRYGPTWSESRIKYKVSDDGARTWSDSDVLAFELGMMVRAHPIVLADGDYLLPIYHETGQDREDVAADTMSLFLRYNKEKRTWTETNRVRSRLGNLQPAVVQIDDNYLVAYCRRGGGYGPLADGFVVRTESRDGGRTWNLGADSPFPNPNSAVDFIKLRNGHLLLVYNDNNRGERMPLTAAISTDNDRTYPHRRNIVDREGTAAYPTAIQTRDGKIHVVFTSHERTQIDHAVFEESAILK